MAEIHVAIRRDPDFAALHPGYRCVNGDAP